MSLNLNTIEFSRSTDPTEDPPSKEMSLDVDEELSFTAGFNTLDLALDGFDEHGVRENRDEDGELRSVDVVYEAMEPGDPESRNGVRITPEFLKRVAEKDYGETTPYMLGHSDRPLDEIGKLRKVWFDESVEKLMVMNRVFNTGAPTHDEVVKRLTHNPPTMTEGSIGFGDQYEAIRNEDGEPELIDGAIREFSTVPFPGGYDEGGLGLPNTAFSEAVTEAAEFDDEAHGGNASENSALDVETKTVTF